MYISKALALMATLALATSAAIPHAGRDLDITGDASLDLPRLFVSHDRQPRPFDPPGAAKRHVNLDLLHFITEDVARARPIAAKRDASPRLDLLHFITDDVARIRPSIPKRDANSNILHYLTDAIAKLRPRSEKYDDQDFNPSWK